MLEHFRDLQLKPQPQRLQILELLNALMLRHRNALKEMGSESIVGITDLVSGEKDPRNLMVIFSILKVVMVEWDISGLAEVGSSTQMPLALLIIHRLCLVQCFAISPLLFAHHRTTRTELLLRI